MLMTPMGKGSVPIVHGRHCDGRVVSTLVDSTWPSSSVGGQNVYGAACTEPGYPGSPHAAQMANHCGIFNFVLPGLVGSVR